MRASLNISLPQSMKEWVDAQVKNGGYGTASEFIRELLRREQHRLAHSSSSEGGDRSPNEPTDNRKSGGNRKKRIKPKFVTL